MKTKMKLIFPAAFAAMIFGALSVQAAANPASTPAAPAAAGTNAAAIPTMASLFGDPVIAKGKGFQIKQSELDEVVLGIKSAAAAKNETIPPDQMTAIEAQMLNRLIQIQILLQQSTDADKADGKAKAGLQISNLLVRAGSQEIFDRQLKAVGMTSDELRSKVTQEATATATLVRALGVAATDADAQDFYTNHSADFEQPETAHVRLILLQTMDPAMHAPLPDDQMKAKRKQADDLLKRIQAGEDFATLAMQYSEDPSSKLKGGELPPFSRGELPPQLEAAAFSMKTNSVSDVVTTDYGFFIIKLLDLTPAKKLALTDKIPMSDMTIADYIKDKVMQQKIQKSAPAYLDNLKKGADVEITDPALKTAVEAAAAAATNAPPAMP